jgi:2,4-dienoyl-CoA reductase-like NADH-dependent reductase (Old Yellow Enzyme family)
MYEHLASILGGPPNDYHYALYSAWSEHNWGMIITGNVIVSPDHLTLGRDMLVPKVLTDATIAPFRRLANVIHGDRTNRSSEILAIMQLNHAGRQSSNIIGGRPPFASPLAPSALRFEQKSQGLLSNLFHRLLFQTPRAMSSSDIDSVLSDFVRGALLALKSGFDGVQLHVAHGCKYRQELIIVFH